MNTKALNLQKIQKDHLYMLAALSLLISLFALYIYFVSASVVHVVMRQEAQRGINMLHSEIGQLEAQYIGAQHMVSSDIVSLNGYVSISDKIFIDRSDATLVLSTNSKGAN